jgi:hypothetical protein
MAVKIYNSELAAKKIKQATNSILADVNQGAQAQSEYFSAGIPEDLNTLPNYNEALFQTVQDRITSNEPVNYAENGLFHTAIPLQTISYKRAPNEHVVQNEGSYMVLGTDRPAGLADGYGAMGSNIANSIDLVVGRMSGARKGKGPPGQEEEAAQVDNSFFADAARIHISQLTDIDKNFGIVQTDVENVRGRSGIGIKADEVRLIGRTGIKIVTGKADGLEGGESNSLGGKIIQPAPSIDLIAGNNTGTVLTWGGLYRPIEEIPNLQPILKGYITRDCFLELSNIIDDIWSSLYTLTLTQIMWNAVLGVSFWEPWRPGPGAATVTNQIMFVMNTLYHVRTNKALWEFNYLTAGGYKYICSRNVNTT